MVNAMFLPIYSNYSMFKKMTSYFLGGEIKDRIIPFEKDLELP